jgi:hypothetical protein
MMRIAGLVWHDAYMLAANTITTIVFIKNDFFLEQHYQLTRFCMFIKKIFFIMKFIDTFPSTACKRFHISREANIFKYRIPVKWKGKITE